MTDKTCINFLEIRADPTAVIHAGFGVRQMFGGQIFEGRNEMLLLGKALKCEVIFQKYALKLIRI